MAFDEIANTTSGAASHAMILIDIRKGMSLPVCVSAKPR
jgi:hypothetical protein